MTQPHCRTATGAEVAQILDWAAQEGWNPGRDDANAFFAADPGGFFLAQVGGIPVAAISVVNHSTTYAFLGLYLCRAEYRGKGIGFALWQHALAHAGDRTVGLDGVPAQEANYARSGFVLADRTRRLEGHLPDVAQTMPLAQEADFDALLTLDTDANGIERPAFLRDWLRNGPTRKTVFSRQDTRITGFATARLCREGCKIGPIIAPDAQAAKSLAQQAAAALAQTQVIIDVPDSRPAFGAILRENGFAESFSTARMYRGPAPRVGPGLQAVATLELG